MPDERRTDLGPLLDERRIDQLRAGLARFTVDAVHDLLGPAGRAAHERGDLHGVARALRRADDWQLASLVRLFLLGRPVGERAAAVALQPLPLPAAAAAGLVETSGDEVRALLDVRPYSEDGAPPWWVVSDFGADTRPGPLAPDHVLGVGAASVTLAHAVPRSPVHSALDLGTGSGVQALHLGRHAARVCATDTNRRALRCAATTAALSGQHWDLRVGSLFEPVAGERFDLVVANPPFVISGGPGHGPRYEYRDSGSPGDSLCARLLGGVADVLSPDGVAVSLANWLIPRTGAWQDRLAEWVAEASADVWVWQREVAELGEYVTMWLRDVGEVPGTARFAALYERWLDWFEQAGAAAVGMGLAIVWRTADADRVRVFEDVPQSVQQPIGALLHGWIDRQRWLARRSDAQLLENRLRPAPDLVRTIRQSIGEDGWTDSAGTLRLEAGMRWELELDAAVAGLVAATATAPSLQIPVALLAESLGVPTAEVARAAAPVVRDLVARGMLLPEPDPVAAPAGAK